MMLKSLLPFFLFVLISLLLLMAFQSNQVAAQVPAPLQAKPITPTPTPNILPYQSSGHGMSIMGVVLLIIFIGGFLFGYWRITH